LLTKTTTQKLFSISTKIFKFAPKPVKILNMREITIGVNETDYEFVLKVLQKLDVVTIIENKKAKKELQKKMLQERFIHAFKEAKLIEQGKLEAQDAFEFLAELEKEDNL